MHLQARHNNILRSLRKRLPNWRRKTVQEKARESFKLKRNLHFKCNTKNSLPKATISPFVCKTTETKFRWYCSNIFWLQTYRSRRRNKRGRTIWCAVQQTVSNSWNNTNDPPNFTNDLPNFTKNLQQNWLGGNWDFIGIFDHFLLHCSHCLHHTIYKG